MIKHMVNLKDQRFCNDPVFPYVLMDLKNRYQSRKFTRFFFSSNPTEAAMSAEQLLQLSESDLLKKFYPVLHPSLGSIAYYKKISKRLKYQIKKFTLNILDI